MPPSSCSFWSWESCRSCAGMSVALPQSQAGRALLAYLALTPRRHRRERLCAMFCESASRWSASSKGGPIAIYYAARHPEHVSRLILLEAIRASGRSISATPSRCTGRIPRC